MKTSFWNTTARPKAIVDQETINTNDLLCSKTISQLCSPFLVFFIFCHKYFTTDSSKCEGERGIQMYSVSIPLADGLLKCRFLSGGTRARMMEMTFWLLSVYCYYEARRVFQIELSLLHSQRETIVSADTQPKLFASRLYSPLPNNPLELFVNVM